MTPGLSNIRCHERPYFLKLVNRQIRHQATHKVGCQPGDCMWSQARSQTFLWGGQIGQILGTFMIMRGLSCNRVEFGHLGGGGQPPPRLRAWVTLIFLMGFVWVCMV